MRNMVELPAERNHAAVPAPLFAYTGGDATMFTMRFTERPYVAYTEADVKPWHNSTCSVRATSPSSNSHFDPAVGARL